MNEDKWTKLWSDPFDIAEPSSSSVQALAVPNGSSAAAGITAENQTDQPPIVVVQSYESQLYSNYCASGPDWTSTESQGSQTCWYLMAGGTQTAYDDWNWTYPVGSPTNIDIVTGWEQWTGTFPIDFYPPSLPFTNVEMGIEECFDPVFGSSVSYISATNYPTPDPEMTEWSYTDKSANSLISEQTTANMTLYTGGKAIPQAQMVTQVNVWGTVTTSQGAMEYATTPFTLLGRSTDANGNVFVPLPPGAAVDATPQGPYKCVGYDMWAVNYYLTHQTQCTAAGNPDNSRTRIGIGEVVQLGGMPSGTVWSVSGGGTISTIHGAPTFTASLSPSSPTIIAQIAGAKLTTTFNVIAPRFITVSSPVDQPLGTQKTNGTQMGADTEYTITINPTTVSFNNVTFRENPEPSSITVTWPDSTVMVVGFERTTNGWKLACGQIEKNDEVSTPGLNPSSQLFNGTSYVDFSFGNSWTYQYQNDASQWIDFCPLTAKFEYKGSTFQARVTFCGTPGGWQGPY